MKEEKILGVNVAVTNMNDTVKFIKNNIKDLSGKYICVSNVHTTVMSYDDPEYMNIQNSAVLRLPDGKPLSIVEKQRGHKEADRVTGPDLMTELFKDSNLKHYFYGSSQKTLDTLKEKLTEKYPNIKISGMYSPPYRELTEEENKEVIKMINESDSDIIWIGLGAPKQEKWMYNHQGQIKGLMIGVGAGFDFHAGNIKRAPKWMQKCALEWLYRLIQNPKKLFKRYMTTNFKFMKLVKQENKDVKRKNSISS